MYCTHLTSKQNVKTAHQTIEIDLRVRARNDRQDCSL